MGKEGTTWRGPIHKGNLIAHTNAMNGKNRPQLTEEINFEKSQVEKGQVFKKIEDHFRGIYDICLEHHIHYNGKIP
jgi:hypothetical protein